MSGTGPSSVVALDVGGTHVTAGRVDVAAGTVQTLVRRSFPEGVDRSHLLGLISAAALEAAAGPAPHVGIAVPGPFDYARGISRLTHKLEPLFGVDLRKELAASLGTPPSAIDFVNDADAFLIGEWWVGAAAGHRRAAGVTLGTGLGSAYLHDGRIVDTGPHVPPEGSLHLVEYGGRPAEETVSRRALLARYGEPGLDVKDVALRARAGDRRAQDVFAELAGALGELAAPWLAAFGATCFVVGGSISQAWDLLSPGLRDGLSSVPRLQTIAPAAHVEEAALLGAAYRASRESTQELPEASSGPGPWSPSR
jgi:glucokinase